VTVFLLRRLAGGFLQLVVITLLTWAIFFVISDLTGANPAERFAGKTASREQIARVAHQLGTDRPYWVQYADYDWRLLHGDFGYSYGQNRPVADIIFPAAATTASLVVGAALIWLAIGAVIGLVGALRPRSFADRGLMVLALLGISVPVFWLAPMVSYVLAYQPTQGHVLGIDLGGPHRWFPIDGYANLRSDPVQWAYHLVLPWLTFAVGFAAIYARYVRALTLEQLGQDYVRTAVAKGAPRRRVLARHVAPNVAPVVVTLLGLDIGIALGGVLFVEQVFGLPGLGYIGLHSIQQLDYPLVAGVITFAAVIAVVANTIVDIVQGMLDPRVRVGASS
jgi:peptide/nickel transport system permease protein